MAASSSPSVKAFNKSTILLAVALLLCLQFSEIMGHGGPGGGDSGSGTDLRGRKLILVKIWCVIILFGSTFAAGVSPYFLPWNGSFILLGTQFAGGVFLATALMHFLGDANTTFGDLTSKTYPFAFMLAAVGYLLTMLADSILCVLTSRPGEREAKVVEDENTPDEAEAAMDHNPMFVMKASFVGDTLLLILALCFHSIFEGIAVGVSVRALLSQVVNVLSATKADAWRNLWTISLHKVFAAIAMGIALLRMLPKRPFLTTVAYAFAFAISSPVGVGIGIAIDATTQGAVADWIFAISMSLACGVFIYVAINHLIAKGFKPLEKSYFDTPFFKFLAVLAGVAVISVVLIWD